MSSTLRPTSSPRRAPLGEAGTRPRRRPGALGAGSLLGVIAGAAVLAGCVDDLDSTDTLPDAAGREIARPDRRAAAGPRRLEVSPRMLRRFQPIAASTVDAAPPARIALGRRLFSDQRLSADGKVSCSTCHRLDAFGADGTAVSRGAHGVRGRRNTPSAFNLPGAARLMWDGRARDLDEQVMLPFVGEAEMGMPSMDAVVQVIRSDASYVAAFQDAFPGERDAVSRDNLVRAIADFERTLVTRGRWDAYLEGDLEALSQPEKEGLRTFLNAGCMVCHTGKNVGGLTLERAGVVAPWPNQEDLGRVEVTHDPADRMMFRVPSLRNVAETGPYFHDGSVARLEDAVAVMGRHQLGLEMSAEEAGSIAVWLRSLTGVSPDSKAPESAPVPAPTPPPSCGGIGAAPCPLQAWMRGNARPALERRDFAALKGTFASIASLAPPGFTGWSGFAREGGRAAEAHDLDGVSAACEGCHVAHRDRYRVERRTDRVGR